MGGGEDLLVHLAVVAVVAGIVGVAAVGCIGPGLVEHDLAGGDLLADILHQRLKVAIAAGDAAETADLLHGNKIPGLVGDGIADAGGVADHTGAVGTDLAVGVGGAVALNVAHVEVDGAAADIEVADDKGGAIGGSNGVEVLLEGIDRKAIADGEDAQGVALGVHGRSAEGYEKAGEECFFHNAMELWGWPISKSKDCV